MTERSDLAIPPAPAKRHGPIPRLKPQQEDAPAFERISDIATALLGAVTMASKHQCCPSLRIAVTAAVMQLDEIAGGMAESDTALQAQMHRLAHDNIRLRRRWPGWLWLASGWAIGCGMCAGIVWWVAEGVTLP